jgi:hypothetical protein
VDLKIAITSPEGAKEKALDPTKTAALNLFNNVLYNTIRNSRCKPTRPSAHPDARIGRNTIESN